MATIFLLLLALALVGLGGVFWNRGHRLLALFLAVPLLLWLGWIVVMAVFVGPALRGG